MLVRRTLKVSVVGQAIVTKAVARLGYTFSEIGQKAYLSRSTVSRFLSGKPVLVDTFYSICHFLQVNPEEIIDKPKEEGENNDVLRVERSIEFPPEYWEAGTSILSYFSRVLRVKYPSQKIKVRIEQEDLRLRMIIDTPTGEKEKIEKTLEEYGLVVTGKILPESFLSDPFEAMALKNKLEIADLELRQTRQLLAFTKNNS
jgi:transcriptional regulator with XRE-family HTH domain